MARDFHSRATLPERMDAEDCPEDLLFRTLDQFQSINRWFSRYRTLLKRWVFRDMLRDPRKEYRLVDLGAGGCDIARWLVTYARHHGLRLRVLAVDRDPRIIQYAEKANRGFPEIEVRVMECLDIPANEADFVFANHLLHHLSDQEIIALLQNLDSMCLRRYVLSDIIRSPFAWHAFRLSVSPFAHRSFVLADGLTSIQRAFTLRELTALISMAGLGNTIRLTRLFPCRCAIVSNG